jgi:fructokinase
MFGKKQKRHTVFHKTILPAGNGDNKYLYLAAVEGGGASFRCMVAKCLRPTSTAPNDNAWVLPEILYRASFDSSHDFPARTLEQCASFLHTHMLHTCPHGRYDALSVITFGPVGLDQSQPDRYGRILSTSPKAAWRNVDILTPLKLACTPGSKLPDAGGGNIGYELPVVIETDVNAPALAEWLYATSVSSSNDDHPIAKNLSSVAYVTVGTGVGVGLVINGKPVHGLMHPEAGHVPIQALSETAEDDMFTGYSWGNHCPFHGHYTVEGTTCTVALTERLEVLRHVPRGSLSRDVLAELPDDHTVFRHAINALANLCVTLLLTCSTQRIVLGGGLIDYRGHVLLPAIRIKTLELLNGYVDLSVDPTLDTIVTKSSFASDAGVTGALILAYRTAVRSLKMRERVEDENGASRGVDQMQTIRQVAFRYGLSYGTIFGAVFTYLAVQTGLLNPRHRPARGR